MGALKGESAADVKRRHKRERDADRALVKEKALAKRRSSSAAFLEERDRQISSGEHRDSSRSSVVDRLRAEEAAAASAADARGGVRSGLSKVTGISPLDEERSMIRMPRQNFKKGGLVRGSGKEKRGLRAAKIV